MGKKKIIVITGGSSGIGRALCERYLKQDYVVVNADSMAPYMDSPADHVPCDITLAGDMARLYGHVASRYGIPDVLVSNAGQGIHERIAEGDPEKWARVIDINLMGALRFVRAFLPDMLQRKTGDVVFISSAAGRQVYEYGGIYAASKAALNMVANTLRLEVQGLLRVSLVSPGIVDTPFFEHMIGSDHRVEDIGWGSLSAGQVADLVAMMLRCPDSVQIPEMIIGPKQQPL